MRYPLLLPAALVAALPATASAQGLAWVSNTAICPDLRAGAMAEAVLGEGDALLLDSSGITGMEYRCVFSPALDLDAADLTVTTHTGHCEEPGLITPQLFTFRMEREETPRISLFDGSESATVFFACP
ncbi:MAG: hypothetical protein LCH92_09450 [Proteobacteria bacterium]|nr:hypothetical protein [Pseudomonadota bacterium]